MEKASFAFGWIGFGLIACQRHLPDSNESHQQCDELFFDRHLRSSVFIASRGKWELPSTLTMSSLSARTVPLKIARMVVAFAL